MSLPHHESGRAPWIPIVALLALVLGIGAAWWYGRASRPEVIAPEVDALVREGVIEEALGAAADSISDKNRWIDEVPGFENAHLSAAQRDVFVRAANAQRCTCGCGYSLAGCRVYDSTCEVSLPRVEALFDSVRQGLRRQGPV